MNPIKESIRRGMARAFFASAWAEQCEETGNARMLSGKEIMDLIPAVFDPAAWHAADTLLFDMERVNGADIVTLWCRVNGPDQLPIALTFGHYCAMQAMGHGVGLFDYGVTDDVIRVPYVEFGSHSLQRDYF